MSQEGDGNKAGMRAVLEGMKMDRRTLDDEGHYELRTKAGIARYAV